MRVSRTDQMNGHSRTVSRHLDRSRGVFDTSFLLVTSTIPICSRCKRSYEAARHGTWHAYEESRRPTNKEGLLLLFWLLLCSSLRVFAANIATDYDHSANFSQYKTYSWLKVQAADSLWADRIQQDVDKQLAAKGWTKVESNGNATVTAFQCTHDQQTLQTFYDGFGGGWRWRGGGGMGMSTTTTDVTKVGTLVVDIFESPTKQLLWRGTQATISPATPRRTQRNCQRTWQLCSSTFPHHTKPGEYRTGMELEDRL